VALAVAGLVAAAPALADQIFSAGPLPNQYSGSSLTIDQGEAVTFRNSDQSGAMHDVTADKEVGGEPLFKSKLIEKDKDAPVAGIEYLTTGDYPFHCSIHNFMKATLHVTANGTPKTRPAPPPPDTTAPSGTVMVRDAKIAAVLKRGALNVLLRSDEPARFKLTATSGKTTIAKGTATVKGTKRNASLPLTKAGKKLLQSAKSITVKVTAAVNDAADNRAAASATRRLK
jgi:plastocyanin